MKLTKKAEMSMGVIIGAVIAIIILTILVFLIVRGTSDTNRATSCPSKGGVCVDSINCNQQKILHQDGLPLACQDKNEVCCRVSGVQ